MSLKDKEGPKAEGQRDTSQGDWLKGWNMDGSEDGGCSLNAAALEMEKYRKVDSPWRFQAETALTLTLLWKFCLLELYDRKIKVTSLWWFVTA